VIVQGVLVSQHQVDRCYARMQNGNVFSCQNIEAAAEKAGVERGAPAMRLADRLIQHERKAGNIVQIRRGVWEWRAPTVGARQSE
jgi:hypothetical protein